MKHLNGKTLSPLLALVLAAALAGCGDPSSLNENTTAGVVSPQQGNVIGIRPAETRDPNEPFTFPPAPVDTDPAEQTTPVGEHPIDVGELTYGIGTVVEYPFVEPMEGVLAVSVRTYGSGGPEILFFYTENAELFCVNDYVSFSYDPTAEPMDSYDGMSVIMAVDFELFEDIAVAEKPVIYLYPETPTQVSVSLTLDGRLTCTYPAYEDGWNNFTAHPDGTLIAPDGKEYYCLYWEGIQNTEWDFSTGFCVKGSDTAAFLEWALAEQGLTAREANEFIIYWLPRMESNPYNVISFQTAAYTDGAVLEISPAPDSLLRVFMAYYPSDFEVAMEAQALESCERQGFTVVEWGGSEVARP